MDDKNSTNETTETIETTKATKKPRGFAAMTKDQLRDLASRGGKKAHADGKAHKFTPAEARAAGEKGGAIIGQNREHMRAIGRRGGESVSRDPEHMARIGKLGGAVTGERREHMSDIGKRGAKSRNAMRQTDE